MQSCIEAGVNGVNPPGTANQTASTTEDSAVTITLQALMPNDNTPIFSITGNGPLNGSLGSISAASCTSGSCSATVLFTPNTDFNGSDSFNFKVTDGSLESNVATVSISVPEVNDAVTANGDAAVTTENMTLNLGVATLTGNDSAGPANESAQILSLINVTATADTHGSVTLANGVVSYSPILATADRRHSTIRFVTMVQPEVRLTSCALSEL